MRTITLQEQRVDRLAGPQAPHYTRASLWAIRAVGYNPMEEAAWPPLISWQKVAAVPVYEYQCLDNRHRFEVRQGFNDEPVTTCPECGAEVRRVIHPVGIVFKGSGFYATDSRKPSPSAKSPASSDTKTESKPDTDAKPKSEPKSESAAAS